MKALATAPEHRWRDPTQRLRDARRLKAIHLGHLSELESKLLPLNKKPAPVIRGGLFISGRISRRDQFST